MSDDWIAADDNYNNGHAEPWHTWQVILWDSLADCHGALGGVDFGRDGNPGNDNHARVCIAELALEYIAEADAELEADHVNALDIEQGCKDMRTVLDAAEKYANLTVPAYRSGLARARILAAVARIRQ